MKTFESVPMKMADVNEISRMHFQRGWHQLGRHLSFVTPGHCSYCSDGRAKCVVYVSNRNQRLRTCDACMHLGASVLPGEPGYEGSVGHQVRLLKHPNYNKRSRSPEPNANNRSPSQMMTPEKKARVDYYSILWNRK